MASTETRTRTLQGRVVSDKMDKTITVKINRDTNHISISHFVISLVFLYPNCLFILKVYKSKIDSIFIFQDKNFLRT